MPDPAKLRDPASVATSLLRELEHRYPGGVRGYAQEPSRGKGGMEAAVYYLQLDAPGLDESWNRPLVLRLPRGKGDRDLTREAKVQDFLAHKGFPTAASVATGDASSRMGRPWLLMERIAVNDPKANKQHRKTMDRIAEFQSRLHAVDVQGWPLEADGPLVDRRLQAMERQAATAGPRARETIDWLHDHAHVVREEERSVLHTDFLGNVLVTETGDLAAIDWGQAEVGDYHDDVARTFNILCMLPRIFPLPAIREVAGLAVNVAARKYHDAYARFRKVDNRRLRYWSALNTAEWALMFAYGASQVYDERPAVLTHRVASLSDSVAWRLRERFWDLVRTPAFRPL